MTQSKTTRGFLKAKKGNAFKSQPDVTPERAFQLLKAKNPLKDKIKAWKGNTAFCDGHRFYTLGGHWLQKGFMTILIKWC